MSADDRFSLVQRVRFGGLDALQHRNNVEFLRFFETARIEYIATLAPGHAPTSPNAFGFIFAECPGGSAPHPELVGPPLATARTSARSSGRPSSSARA